MAWDRTVTVFYTNLILRFHSLYEFILCPELPQEYIHSFCPFEICEVPICPLPQVHLPPETLHDKKSPVVITFVLYHDQVLQQLHTGISPSLLERQNLCQDLNSALIGF
jgi:hypothetical protein